jgi:hypothetical protein
MTELDRLDSTGEHRERGHRRASVGTPLLRERAVCPFERRVHASQHGGRQPSRELGLAADVVATGHEHLGPAEGGPAPGRFRQTSGPR